MQFPTNGNKVWLKIMAKNPKFTVLYEKLRGQSFEINQETMSIGRRNTADICLPDGSVSGHHADIIKSTDANGEVCYVLRDNDSTNGTRVNNEAVTEKILNSSDLITFGNVEVLFDAGDERDRDNQNTHTIDIGSASLNTATTQTLVNFNPLAETEKKKKVATGMFIVGAAVLLGAVVIYLAVRVLTDL